jgi:hypothetical protein
MFMESLYRVVIRSKAGNPAKSSVFITCMVIIRIRIDIEKLRAKARSIRYGGKGKRIIESKITIPTIAETL